MESKMKGDFPFQTKPLPILNIISLKEYNRLMGEYAELERKKKEICVDSEGSLIKTNKMYINTKEH